MTSGDPWQVSTAILRLRRAAELVNPAHSLPEILQAVTEVAAILREPPGDPDAVEAQAAAFHALAALLATTSMDTGHIATGPVPRVWEGEAATAATATLKATRDLIEQASAAMRTAGHLLDDHAETLRRLHKQLDVHRTDLAQARRFPGIRMLVKAFLAIRGALGVFERLHGAAEQLRRGMREIEGRAQAGAIHSTHVPASGAVRLAGTGILTAIQLKRAAANLDALSTSDAARMRALLDDAVTEAERAYLLKAMAAGHSVDAIVSFAGTIHGQGSVWLDRRLNPLSGDEGRIVRQFDETACGSTTIMVTRAMNDPIYALSLDSEERIRAEEQRIHDSTNRVWPQRLGTTPWGLTGELNRYGTQYDWRAVDDTVAGSVNPALEAAVGAVDAGHTVPVLIGDGYPKHFVLLIGHEGGELVFYNPSGEVTRVSEADFRDGNMSALGYRHVQGVVTPR
ncbi:MAG TPA: hypothetical protein VFC19_03455 [Candidatus Limnocylindrales bacterium]|nr:hypothetical protein [Candidatus Limnocylindrales bacterium]